MVIERDRPERRMGLDSVFASAGESGRVPRGYEAHGRDDRLGRVLESATLHWQSV